MTKKRDHLFAVDDIARSVLLEQEITAVCGVKRVLTRDQIDNTTYHGACKDCMAKHAKTSEPDDMVIAPKRGWLALVERAWRERYAESLRPRVSFTTRTSNMTAGGYAFKVDNITAWNYKMNR